MTASCILGVDGNVDNFLNCLCNRHTFMNPEKLWSDVLASLKVSLSAPTIQTWFKPSFIVSVRNISSERQVVEIGCSSSFVARGIEERYFDLLQETLNQATGLKNDILFTVKQKPRAQVESVDPLFSFDQPENKELLERTLKNSRIRPGFTFENFAVSGTNQMAHAAAEAVSRNPGDAYNPLFFYGGVGVGKTHLMLAIAYDLLKKDINASVLYCTGEEFTNEIVEAIRSKTTQAFKNKYRNLKLLMVDDIQFIAGKDRVQEEFFHTFNTLQAAGAQITLTSDRPPHEIDKLEARLRSRVEAGLIVDISPPDFELRAAITLIKAKERGFELPMDVAQAIAANIDSPRRIEGFITLLMTQVSLNNESLNLETVSKLLGARGGDVLSFRPSVSPQSVISAVSEYYSLGKRSLLGASRAQMVALPRQVLMYLLRTDLGLPLQEVGRLVGGRDHTTVMHAVDKISKNLSANRVLSEDILGIKRSLSV